MIRKGSSTLELNIYNEAFVSATKGMKHTRSVVHKISRRLENSYKVEGNGRNQITFGSPLNYADIEENKRKHFHFKPGVDVWTNDMPNAMIRAFNKTFT